jgi:hypothetical protein
MKKLVFAALMFCGTLSYSQARLGSSWFDIYSEFKEYSPETRTTDDGELLMVVSWDKIRNYYYFTDKRQCYRTVIYPTTDGALNGLVEIYNKRYVVVSNTEWKMYSCGLISSIKLINHDGVTFFLWEFVE